MGKSLSETTGRFVACDDGNVLDNETNLVWAAEANDGDIDWQNAKAYCESYGGGGGRAWRMPTQNELYGLYEALTRMDKKPIKMSSGRWIWASDTEGSSAAVVAFDIGQNLLHFSKKQLFLALKVVFRFHNTGTVRIDAKIFQ